MIEDVEISQGKSMNDLGHEALWFAAHTIIAVLTMLLTVFIMSLFHLAPTTGTMVLGTVLAFTVPLIVGLAIARAKHNEIARYVWISGLLIFSIVCVWVIDLPTGNGLCEGCAGHLFYRLGRTFFSIDNGSGLMGGQGVLVGCWVPLSLIGYAIGAKLGLDS